jgi:hypothetical protein
MLSDAPARAASVSGVMVSAAETPQAPVVTAAHVMAVENAVHVVCTVAPTG